MHLAETVFATGTQGARKLTLAHSCLARNYSIADVGTIDTSTIEKAGREHLEGPSFGSDLLGGRRCAPDNFPIRVLVRDRAVVEQ